MIKAVVYKSTGSHYLVKNIHGRMLTCTLRGKLKIDESISSSNPIAVGDEVLYEPDGELGIIRDILPRKNHIVRASPQNRKHQQHIIASNIDLAVILATLSFPKTSLGFIDRFLITAEIYHIPTLILYNKIDLHDEEDREWLNIYKDIYEQAGYLVQGVSAVTDEGMVALEQQLKGKTTLFSGHSGVGKSSILNRLLQKGVQKISEVSDWSGKGKHTTTFAEMMDLPFGGRVIDTPGVKEFGLVNIERSELSQYFPEMRTLIPSCKFNNCQHLQEPGCAIKEAVQEGSISVVRYESYLQIRDSIQDEIY